MILSLLHSAIRLHSPRNFPASQLFNILRECEVRQLNTQSLVDFGWVTYLYHSLFECHSYNWVTYLFASLAQNPLRVALPPKLLNAPKIILRLPWKMQTANNHSWKIKVIEWTGLRYREWTASSKCLWKSCFSKRFLKIVFLGFCFWRSTRVRFSNRCQSKSNFYILRLDPHFPFLVRRLSSF